LLEFWAPWCIPCRKRFPFLDELQAKNQRANFKVVAVTLETEDDGVIKFTQDFPGMRFLVGQDRSANSGELMQVTAMPTAFLMDPQGKVLARYEGGADSVHQQIDVAVQTVLVGGTLSGSESGTKVSEGPKGNLKAWERGYLADPIMSLDGDVLKRSMKEHIHASKEAAAGDGGVAGGGCGCN
jgi:thiol-disulfide isomerase/thioredoxin